MSEKTSMKPLLKNMPKVSSKHTMSQDEATKQYEYLKEEYRKQLLAEAPEYRKRIQAYKDHGNTVRARYMERVLKMNGIPLEEVLPRHINSAFFS